MDQNRITQFEVSQQQALQTLEKGYSEAQDILKDEDKLERLIQRTEKKLKNIPKVGGKLAYLPAMISLVKSYVKKEYTDIPVGTIIAVISALVYFLSPVDLIPDIIPGAGHLDDAAVIGACLILAGTDVEEYLVWREANGKNLDV